MAWVHPEQFRRCVARYRGDYKVLSFSCWEQFLAMSFAQITLRIRPPGQRVEQNRATFSPRRSAGLPRAAPDRRIDFATAAQINLNADELEGRFAAHKASRSFKRSCRSMDLTPPIDILAIISPFWGNQR